jgi:hypothetical protein
MDENWTKWPDRWRRRTGRAALVTLTTPNRSASICAEVVVGGLLDGRDVGVAGVVHDHIEGSERVDRHLDSRARGRGVGDVERDRADAIAVLPHEIVELLWAAGSRDHLVPAVERGLGELPPQATGATGDEPCPCHARPLGVLQRTTTGRSRSVAS